MSGAVGVRACRTGQVTANLARASERGYTQGMDAPSIGRSLRERNIAAMSPERRLDLWEIEVREFVDLLPDVARREFVRRFRRNHPAPAGEPSPDVDGISDTPSHEAPDANP